MASHSPQVDPILDDLAEALAEHHPDDTARFPTTRRPRSTRASEPVLRCRLLGGQPAPHGAVRRGGAGRARGRLPGLRRAVAAPAADPRRRADRPQPRHAASPRWPACAASRRCRTGCAAWWPICTARAPRWTSPCCTRTGGWWTRRCRPGPTVGCCLTATVSESSAHGGHTVSVHPLLGAHVRLPEEPERHVWQAEVGTAALPWLADHQIRNVAVLPGAAYCEMALAAARTVLGDASEVRDIRFEQMLLLDERDPGRRRRVGRGARRRRLRGGDRPGRRARAAGHRGPARRRGRRAAARARHRRAAGRASAAAWTATSVRQWLDERGVQYGPAFTGLAAVHTGEEPATRCWPRSRCPARSARSKAPTACTRHCWMPASSPLRPILSVQAAGNGGAAAAAGCPPAARLRSGPQRPLLLHPGDQADASGDRGRPRRPRRARHRAAGRARAAMGTGAPRAATAIACWPSGC